MGWWRRYLQWRQRNVASLALTPDGFALSNAGQSVSIIWADLIRIVTFKRDLATVDLICLAFELPGGAVEINEEMPGYAHVETEMARRFNPDPEWKLRRMFPAFAPNIETIYERPTLPEPA